MIGAVLARMPVPVMATPPPLNEALIDELTTIVFGDLCPPEPCGLIFIFGGSHPGIWQTGAQAYHAGLAPVILATGGYKPTAIRHHTWEHGAKPEAHVIRDELVALGVPLTAIHVEDRSANTLENVRFALQVYDFDRVGSVLTVCRSHGVGRQVRTLHRHLAAHVKIVPYPFDTIVGRDGPLVTRATWMQTAEGRAAVFSHLLKILKYGALGHLTPLESISTALREAVVTWATVQARDAREA